MTIVMPATNPKWIYAFQASRCIFLVSKWRVRNEEMHPSGKALKFKYKSPHNDLLQTFIEYEVNDFML